MNKKIYKGYIIEVTTKNVVYTKFGIPAIEIVFTYRIRTNNGKICIDNKELFYYAQEAFEHAKNYIDDLEY